jgi:hypothetical protein
VRPIPISICFAFTTLLVGCGAIKDNALTNGVSREDARAIRRVVLAAHPKCEIYNYRPDPRGNGDIYCATSCKTYLLRRTRQGWKLLNVEILTVA